MGAIGRWFKRSWETIKRWAKTSGSERREEARCLREAIEGAAPDDRAHAGCFLVHRFETPFVHHRKWGPWYGRLFTFFSLLTIAAGAAASAISTHQDILEDQSWIILVLGIVVALTTAINQVWKPGLRSVSSYRAGNALRREGWDFVHGRGRYQSNQAGRLFGGSRDDAAASKRRFSLFVDHLQEIQAQVDALDEVQAELPEQARDS